MGFSELVRDKTDSIWQAIFDHPMVQGLGDGTLPKEKFHYWLSQYYLYLKDYARVMALGAVKAQDLETMGGKCAGKKNSGRCERTHSIPAS